MQSLSPKRPRFLQLLLLALVVFAIFFSLQPITRSQTDFYNNLWAPAYLLTQRESPYNTASLQPELPALWMPTAVGLFSFLGFFEFNAAQQIWFFLNIAGLALFLHLSLPEEHLLSVLLAGMFLAYFFPPTINHFSLGQVSILSALCLFLAVKRMERHPWRSAFFLAVGMVKPQIGFFILFGVGFYQFRSGGLKKLFSYGLKAFLAALTLTLPLFLAKPNWIPDFIASLQANTLQWKHPSILFQLDGWMGNWKYLPWGVLLLGAFWLIIRLWKNEPPHVAALWTLALTVLITPYVWSWDFVLLLPLFVYVFSISNWQGKALLLIGYGLVWVGMAFIQLSTDFHNSRFWWAPISFMGVLTLAAQLRHQNQIQSKP